MRINRAVLIENMNNRGINQGQLAAGAGIRNATVSGIITGKSNPRIMTIGKIAAFLGCEVSELCAEVAR